MKLIAEGLQFPEGPVYCADGSILLVELTRGTLSRIDKGGRLEIVANLGGGPNGAALGRGDRVYVCNNGGVKWWRDGRLTKSAGIPSDDYVSGRLEVVHLGSGKHEVLYDRCDSHSLRGPNDLVLDRDGNIWFTDMGKPSERTLDLGSVFWARADGSEIREVIRGLITPNGIGLSADGRKLYVSETLPSRLWSWDITEPGGVRTGVGPMAHGGYLIHGSRHCQAFDSLKITESGRVCVGTLINGGITEIDPSSGSSRHHPLPDTHVTNLCFGGDDRRTAFVTLSERGLLIALKWREAGIELNQ
jgi:gluconolactonase